MGLTIYKASAGSGKTFTLVQLYLEKVIRRTGSFRTILAITFTNKATEEMKTRIIRELDQLANQKESKHLLLLQKALGLSEDEIRQKAGVALRNILHDYSSFAVTTIDSYFQTLSKVLARELHLPARFDIELNVVSVSDRVVNRLLSKVGLDPQITRWLQDFIIDRITAGKTWNILPDLKSMSSELIGSGKAYDANLHHSPESIREIRNLLQQRIKEVEQKLFQLSKEALEACEAAGYSESTFTSGIKGPYGYFHKIYYGKDLPRNYTVSDTVAKASQDALLFLRKAQQSDAALVSFVEKELRPRLEAGMQYYAENSKDYLTCKALNGMLYSSGLSGSIANEAKKLRDEESFMLLSDTTRMLAELVGDDDAQFIFEKSGNTYQHTFIDEFQDTSSQQWQILRPLVLNALATGNDALIVGDAKQSIYRWRGGNMDLLLYQVKDEFKAFRSEIQELNLKMNYRSLEKVVTFNNAFFLAAASVFPEYLYRPSRNLEGAYEEEALVQSSDNKTAGQGYVKIATFISDKKSDLSEEEAETKWKQKALAYLIKQIDDLLKRDYQLRDICLLVRTKREEQEIADYLLDQSPFVFISANSMRIAPYFKVQLMIQSLRYLFDDSNRLLIQEIGSSYEMYQTTKEEEIPFRMRHGEEKEIFIIQKLREQKQFLLSLPVDQCLMQIRSLLELQAADPYLDKFHDLTGEYCARYSTQIRAFLAWWDQESEESEWSIEVPAQTNAIRILSIHKSKGLEFPIVFIPFLEWKIAPKYDSLLWASTQQEPYCDFGTMPVKAVKGLEQTHYSDSFMEESDMTLLDNLNLLYVAFTRAGRELHLYGPQKTSVIQLAQVFHATLDQLPFLEKGEETEDYFTCFSGTPTLPSAQSREEQVSLYQPEVLPPVQRNDVNDTGSGLTFHFNYENSEIRFGNQIHEAMALLTQSNQLEEVIHKICFRHDLLPASEAGKELAKSVRATWHLLEQAGWTNAEYRILAEMDFFDGKGDIQRPDRVMLGKNKAIVIDFKTGAERKDHQAQVVRYIELLKEIGIQEVSGYLVYTDRLTIEEVKPGAQLSIL